LRYRPPPEDLVPTLSVIKTRGSALVRGAHAFNIDHRGIRVLGRAFNDQVGVKREAARPRRGDAVGKKG
jgi:hypothetical protein